MFNWILPISLLILFEIIADIFSKEYSLKGGWLFWCLGILGYVVANIFWLSAIKNGSGLARGATIFAVGSGIVAATIGLYFYNESVSKVQFVGIIFGLVSLVLIFWE